jgi:redox-sensing transcriptional repressor
MKLPPRTVERLSKYRRLLSKFKDMEEVHIFSHRLAGLLNLSPEQVRRDLMLIGLTGNHRRGYNIKSLVDTIGNIIDREAGHNIALVGIGNLGKAVMNFIQKTETKMNIVAAFDIDKNKVNTMIAGIQCFNTTDMARVIKDSEIGIAILTVPPEVAAETSKQLVNAGIKGILNFTSVHIDVPGEVYIKDYDIITSLEEIGFFVKE